ncbi:COP9 signalosome complex subunit 5 [Cladophialophora psammophila CBS 110553]|uniref:COP9 signalosome complex subunit 5 n=1 Tax=Cladophialophora psammophila CBS 110553 TaxID=1182543 RepID=W9XCB4_9EURO|nr:COP9 signalosome complex subunit 5 [Cladophialophora psammophila CBS 110553]EXJ74960.1 COP9 signalosome complex subunit 5 [Cladophialophora psammophila CBS 110553]
MSTLSALRNWEAENNVITIDPFENALYNLPDPAAYRTLQDSAPWKKDPNYFTHVRISALALLKMTTHARSGGSLEIMGLMIGYVSGRSLVITDAFRLPVEGTETRVNAHADADEYMVNFGIASREGGGQLENAVGWYHSHPGYGCWLSGIDVHTQKIHQMANDPFVAVVIDPDRTVSAGKVEIGAFRTYPEGHQPKDKQFTDDSDEYQAIPQDKIQDFGVHANSYYPLEVTHYKSTLDTHLLGLLWNKYWTSTLSQSPLFTNRDFTNKQIADHAVKIKAAATKQRTGASMSRRGQELVGPGDKNFKVVRDGTLEQIVRGGNKIATEEIAGLLANEVKQKLFWGVVQEARHKAAHQTAPTTTEVSTASNGG